jgi:hypothetical protein
MYFENNSDKRTNINTNGTFKRLPRDRNRLVLNLWKSEDLHLFKYHGAALNRPNTQTVEIDSHSEQVFTGCVLLPCDKQNLCPRLME